MSRIPKDPKSIFSNVVDDYKRIFGKDLVSVMVYGSAASGEYKPGKSDINFMVVLSEAGMDGLDRALGVVSNWRKHNVATPLFLTENYIRTSLDVFPVEYLNLKNNYQMIYGKDILDGLIFAPQFVRLQCEREIKGKLLLLREAFLETGGKAKRLRGLAGESLKAFSAIFVGLLYLKGQPLPERKRDITRKMCDMFGMDKVLFDTLFDVGEERTMPSEQELIRLFMDYLKQIRKLWMAIDRVGEDEGGH
jgi:hypothetical protein